MQEPLRPPIIQEPLRPPINVEEELNKALEDRSSPITMGDVSIYFRSAFKSFVTKIAVVELLTSLAAIVIFNFIQPYLSPVLNYWIVWGFALLLLVIIVTVIVRANSGLIRVAKTLSNRNATYRLNEKRNLAQINSLLEQRKTYKDLYEANAVLYGLAFDTNSTTVTIDKGGKALIETRLLLNATRPGIKVIERYSHVVYGGYDDRFELDIPEKEYVLDSGELVIVRPEIINHSPMKIEWMLSANPEFPVNIPLEYVYVEKTPDKAFSMNQNELDKSGNDHEWFSQQISYPTKRLFIKVIFPKGYRPQRSDVAIWVTPNVKRLNSLEHKRIIEIDKSWNVKISKDIVILSLAVEFPITGIHYAVTWLPMLEWA